jgi:uncharacterized protein with GYD domain
MKFRQKPTKELFAENLKFMEKEKKEGIKNLGIYWTLGRFDAVVIMEAPNEKIVMKSLMRRGWAASQPLVAIPAVEARKLVE